jgi:small nuclear ribonucleoprotein (snRNP)-like protein
LAVCCGLASELADMVSFTPVLMGMAATGVLFAMEWTVLSLMSLFGVVLYLLFAPDPPPFPAVLTKAEDECVEAVRGAEARNLRVAKFLTIKVKQIRILSGQLDSYDREHNLSLRNVTETFVENGEKISVFSSQRFVKHKNIVSIDFDLSQTDVSEEEMRLSDFFEEIFGDADFSGRCRARIKALQDYDLPKQKILLDLAAFCDMGRDLGMIETEWSKILCAEWNSNNRHSLLKALKLDSALPPFLGHMATLECSTVPFLRNLVRKEKLGKKCAELIGKSEQFKRQRDGLLQQLGLKTGGDGISFWLEMTNKD